MTSITVFFPTGEERTFTDTEQTLYDFLIRDGHCHISEQVRLIPRKKDSGWKQPRALHCYAPGTWREVEIDYGS